MLKVGICYFLPVTEWYITQNASNVLPNIPGSFQYLQWDIF